MVQMAEGEVLEQEVLIEVAVGIDGNVYFASAGTILRIIKNE